ncbi:phenylalanine--tRNA ligase subunit alpha [Mesoaciditoga sp.]
MKDIRDMLMESIKERIKKLESLEDVEKARVSILGKKGFLKEQFKKMKDIPPEERAEFGKALNLVKEEVERILSSKIEEFKAAQKKNEALEKSVDLTIPGAKRSIGRLHLITQMIQECVEVFERMGFEVVEGPEIENTYYNFEALNTPQWHPARDLHDTFYIDDKKLLRTHTSPVQIRTMELRKPPLRVISPGRVYRKDYDASHLPAFFQIEGLAIDKNISIADLKGTLENVIKSVLGEDKKVRFRPHYFPFTEPSVEVDVSFPEGKSGWLELLGAGMVHPNVLRNVGLDPNEWQGFAFGMGIERLAMLKYGVDDIREFPRNSLNFLKLF